MTPRRDIGRDERAVVRGVELGCSSSMSMTSRTGCLSGGARRSGAAFGAPVTVGTSHTNGPVTMAFGDRVIYIAWESSVGSVRLRRSTTGASSWGAARTIQLDTSGHTVGAAPWLAARGSRAIIATSTNAGIVVRSTADRGATWAGKVRVTGSGAIGAPIVTRSASGWWLAYASCGVDDCEAMKRDAPDEPGRRVLVEPETGRRRRPHLLARWRLLVDRRSGLALVAPGAELGGNGGSTSSWRAAGREYPGGDMACGRCSAPCRRFSRDPPTFAAASILAILAALSVAAGPVARFTWTPTVIIAGPDPQSAPRRARSLPMAPTSSWPSSMTETSGSAPPLTTARPSRHRSASATRLRRMSAGRALPRPTASGTRSGWDPRSGPAHGHGSGRQRMGARPGRPAVAVTTTGAVPMAARVFAASGRVFLTWEDDTTHRVVLRRSGNAGASFAPPTTESGHRSAAGPRPWPSASR